MTPPECGCRVEALARTYSADEEAHFGAARDMYKWTILYCPKHQAVDRLVEAAKLVADGHEWETCLEAAKEAIAQAEGGKDVSQ